MLVFSFVLVCMTSLSFVASGNDYTLKSLNVFFRHGDRTPLRKVEGGKEYYQNDPYINETFEPTGLGQLTKEGKLREFRLGESLRKQYGDFLGDIYKPTEVVAQSTDYPRTKMSTQLVLAGLYPPKGEQIWNRDLDWQPIPVLYSPLIFSPALLPFKCPMFKEELLRLRNSSEYRKDLSSFDSLMKELSVITGENITNTKPIYEMYHLLRAETSGGLELPSWTKDYYPDGPMLDAALFHYQTMSYNKFLKKLSGGPAIRKVLKNTEKIIDPVETMKPKIILYGEHEDSLAGMLISLNVWKRIVPEYSSALIFEIYQKDSDHFVKLQYYKGIPAEFEVLVLPGCAEFCPIARFIELTKEIVPESPMEACYGPYWNSRLVPSNENPIEWMYKKLETIFDM